MNLLQKLHNIQSSIRGLKKDANAAGRYSYVSGNKVLGLVRDKMDELGVLLAPNIDSITNEVMEYNVKSGPKKEVLTTLMFTMKWIDVESGEILEVKWAANGQNDFDKGFGSAVTYGERYFLLKFFHIATDEDDVDALPPRDQSEPTPAPAPAQMEELTPDHPKWEAAKAAIQAKTTTAMEIRKRYKLTTENESLLNQK